MIQLLSRLQVADNTGAKQVRMIRRLGQLKNTAGVGDIIVCHVKESSVDASVKKGSVVRAVVVRTKSPMRRRDGSYLRFDENACVIVKIIDSHAYIYHIVIILLCSLKLLKLT